MNRREDAWRNLLAIGVIAASALAAYHNTLSVPFLYDDEGSIENNPSIRHLGSLGSVLFPPNDVLTSGRPLLNLAFALNYALGGISVRGYHEFNLLIHILAGITLFGIVKATLLLPATREKYGGAAPLLALAIAAVWTLHPILTESVTYISQRAESMMGLCYMLTLYFFIRSIGSSASGRWASLSIAACALGMLTKEVMVSAPLIVLTYDRAFVAGTFREALRRRERTYLGLAATWLVLGALMVGSRLRLAHGVGYGADFTWWTYALTESKVLIAYLGLVLWPHPLVFDYGPDLMINRAAEAAPYIVILLLLLMLTLLASRRSPKPGFLGVCFFVILAPTSSFVPVIRQPMAENRLYLPSAAIVALEIFGLFSLVGRKGLLVAFPALAIAFGILTSQRNLDYRDKVAIWSDSILKYPQNSRAHSNLGEALATTPGRLPDAIAQFEASLRINPNSAEVHNNLGVAFAKVPGRLPDAIAQYEAALKVNPAYAEARYNLGTAFAKTPGRLPDAIAQYEAALRINPDYAKAHNNLGAALEKVPGRLPDAIAHFEAALKIDPAYAEAHNNLGNALARAPNRLPDAIAQYEAALRINPDYADAHNNLGTALTKVPGRLPDAIAQYEAALKINPESSEVHYNLGAALAKVPARLPEMIAHLEAASKFDPKNAEVHYNLGVAYSRMPGRLADAIAHFEAALKIDPDDAEGNYFLGIAYTRMPGRLPDAIAHFEAALKINPDFAEAHFNLGNALLKTGGRDQEASVQIEDALRLRPDWEPLVARLRSVPNP